MGLKIPDRARTEGVGLLASPPKPPPVKAKAAPTRKAAPRKPRKEKDPLVLLKLTDARHALLVAPASYLDCRDAERTARTELIGRPSTLYRLRYGGAMRGFPEGKGRPPLWVVPSEAYPTLQSLPRKLAGLTRRTSIELVDDVGQTVTLTVFQGPFQWLELRTGDQVVVSGELSRYPSGYYLSCELRVPEGVADRVWTRYRGIPGQITGDRVELLVAAAHLDEAAPRVCAALAMGETAMREADLMAASASASGARFESFAALLSSLHRPETVAQGMLALECAKRISALAVQAAALRHHSRPAHPSAPLPLDTTVLDRIASALPVSLTASQLDVARTVCRRMGEPVPLSALLSGDVGTGKTLAFLLPAVAAHLAGARVAIMTPRQLLADQIAGQVLERFGSFVTNLERIETGGRIDNPQSILVGTMGMITVAQQRGYVPQLLIVDEQQKLNPAVREALVGPGTHVLEVSATPVPRSLAASLYDGLEILNLRECPVNKKIASSVIDMKERGRVIAALRQVLQRGERAAMVYPRVSSDADGVQSVQTTFESLDAAFPGQCVMLHGQMEDEQLKRSIEQFRRGERRLVVASTVLEIGLDIPSISLMVVRDADCFGISQLHQLRGRLVRNGGAGEFLMVVDDLDALPPETAERLHAVARTADGYELAEIDLLQRGFGEIDGEAQTGAAQTLFRLVQLRVEDFMARKLRSVAQSLTETPSRRTLARADPDSPRYVQERLL